MQIRLQTYRKKEMRTVLKKKFNWKCSIGKKTINNLDDSWRENSKLRIYDALTMVSTIRVTTGHEPFYETISKLSHLPEKFTGQMGSPSGHSGGFNRCRKLPVEDEPAYNFPKTEWVGCFCL